MIIEIALGIVLAVVILALLPYIIALGAVVVVSGLALAAIALVVWFLWDPALAIVLAVGAVLYGGAHLLNRKLPHLDIGALMVFLFFGGLLAVASFEVIAGYEASLEEPVRIVILALADLVLVLSVVSWNKKSLIEWNQRNVVTSSYQKASQESQD